MCSGVNATASNLTLPLHLINNTMEKKLFVGGISFSTTEDQLREMFEKAGKVESVKIITDKFSGRSKGFGFVEFETEEDAQKAIEMFHEQEDPNGRKIIVNEARPFEPRNGGQGGGGNF